MKTWIACALGVVAGALIVLGHDAMNAPAQHSAQESSAAARNGSGPFVSVVPHRPQSFGQVTESTGPPAPARHGESSKDAASPPAAVEEKPPLPPYLRKQLETDPPGIAQLHLELEHEARDPNWAPVTEYQMQEALQEASPELLSRIQLYQTTCASSMCEMTGEFSASTPEQRSQDVLDWQELLNQAANWNSWKATGLGPPLGAMFIDSPDGHPAFIVEFRKPPPVGNKSEARPTRLNRT